MSERKIYTAKDRVEAEMICSLLESNGIPSYYKGIGIGGYMDIYAGNSMQGEEVFVNEEQYDEAIKLLTVIQTENEFDSQIEDDSVNEDDMRLRMDIQKRKKLTRVVCWIVAVGFIATVIWHLVEGMIH